VAKKYGTGNATQIVTVTAKSSTATKAQLSVWKKVGAGWVRVLGPLTAHVGADGVGRASEYTSKTPVGSFTLTHAFGIDGNPGTRLPYFVATRRDWWVGQSGRYYNTHQRCKAGQSCPWHSPSEQLGAIWQYAQAVVIDYNTRNAPGGVKQHAGSAFFFHVTDGRATGGCVAIPKKSLIKIMKWLNPARHPRIIVGRS
jgi:L,D-peptidoglycan transpeptidase YkuD (ErfK/YbiS/YcfS/YnhG family)